MKEEFRVLGNPVPMERRLANAYSLMLVCSERAELSVNEVPYSITGPSLVLLSPGDLVSFKSFSALKDHRRFGYEITLDHQWIERVSDEGANLLECFTHKRISRLHCIMLTPEQYSGIEGAFLQLKNLKSSDQGMYGALLESKLAVANILISVNRFYRENNSFTSENRTLIVSDAVQRVSDYIRSNYWDDIDIEMLSVQFGINRNQLCRQFRELMGTSPIRYLINYRLSCACSFLEEGFSVEETCDKVGFGNLPHFSKSFKKRFGLSPKQYQLDHKGRS